ncbi:hypothetical protein ig2599ANME_0262 [groundwater metagenome]
MEITRIIAIDVGTLGDGNLLEDKLSDSFMQNMKKGGAAAIFIVIIALFFNYYNVINLKNIPVPYFETILWGYLFINAGLATPFHYFKERNTVKCPKCGSQLKVESSYSCDNCGSLKFERKNEK